MNTPMHPPGDTPTPRTDSMRLAYRQGNITISDPIPASFAERLERALAAALAKNRDEESWWKEKHDYKDRAEKAEADYTRVAREFNDLSAKSTFELANLKARVATLASLLEQMLNVAENADETGYVTDCGFIDLDKLHAEVRSALAPATKETK